RADRLEPGDLRPRRPGRGWSPAGSRPARDRRPLRRLDRRRRLRAGAGEGDGPQRDGDRGPGRRRGGAWDRPDRRLDERGVRRPAGVRPYRPDDAPNPINPYGRSKLAGERLAEAAYDGASAELGIVRTAWLFGPPGNDFPSKILSAAERARASGQRLKLVGDEIGSPSYTLDVAEAIAELIGAADVGGIRHVVNSGHATRAEWALEVLRQANLDVPTETVLAAEFPRASTPPRFGVLEPSPMPSGEPLRTWQGATA